MSEEKVFEEELNRTFQLGIAAGLEQASRSVLEEATFWFRKGGHDQIANRLRSVSQELNDEAKKAHPGVPDDEG